MPDRGWYPDPHKSSLLRYWNGTVWTDHTAPRDPSLASTKVRTRWGTVSRRFAVIGILVMLGGFLMGVGMAEPETPREEEQFAQLMNIVWALMLGGFVLLCIGLAVGLIVRLRVGANQQGQQGRDDR